MKMKLFDRLVLTLLMLIGLAISFVLIGFGAGVFALDAMARQIDLSSWTAHSVLIVLGLLGIFFCVKLLFSHPKRELVPISALIKDTQNGAIRISISALNAMAKRAAQQVEGIRELRCFVTPSNQAIDIHFSVVLMPETVAPQLMEALQGEVKKYVQEHAGIMVQHVRVQIEDALPPAQ